MLGGGAFNPTVKGVVWRKETALGVMLTMVMRPLKDGTLTPAALELGGPDAINSFGLNKFSASTIRLEVESWSADVSWGHMTWLPDAAADCLTPLPGSGVVNSGRRRMLHKPSLVRGRMRPVYCLCIKEKNSTCSLLI